MKKLIFGLFILTSCSIKNTYHYEIKHDSNVLVLNDGTTLKNAIPIKTNKKNIKYLTYPIIIKENLHLENKIFEPYYINDSCFIIDGIKYNSVTSINRYNDTITLYFNIIEKY
jgi:hypothetical protein